jgi:hypothetical protein
MSLYDYRYGYPEKNVALLSHPMVIDSKAKMEKLINAYNDTTVEQLMQR